MSIHTRLYLKVRLKPTAGPIYMRGPGQIHSWASSSKAYRRLYPTQPWLDMTGSHIFPFGDTWFSQTPTLRMRTEIRKDRQG